MDGTRSTAVPPAKHGMAWYGMPWHGLLLAHTPNLRLFVQVRGYGWMARVPWLYRQPVRVTPSHGSRILRMFCCESTALLILDARVRDSPSGACGYYPMQAHRELPPPLLHSRGTCIKSISSNGHVCNGPTHACHAWGGLALGATPCENRVTPPGHPITHLL